MALTIAQIAAKIFPKLPVATPQDKLLDVAKTELAKSENRALNDDYIASADTDKETNLNLELTKLVVTQQIQNIHQGLRTNAGKYKPGDKEIIISLRELTVEASELKKLEKDGITGAELINSDKDLKLTIDTTKAIPSQVKFDASYKGVKDSFEIGLVNETLKPDPKVLTTGKIKAGEKVIKELTAAQFDDMKTESGLKIGEEFKKGDFTFKLIAATTTSSPSLEIAPASNLEGVKDVTLGRLNIKIEVEKKAAEEPGKGFWAHMGRNWKGYAGVVAALGTLFGFSKAEENGYTIPIIGTAVTVLLGLWQWVWTGEKKESTS